MNDTKQVNNNGVMTFIPVAASDLVDQRYKLDAMAADIDDNDLLAELYADLGRKFAEVGYKINADKCAAKSAYYRNLGAY